MKESLIYGLFGGFIGSLYMAWIYSPPTPKCQHACCRRACMAVVDMQALISKKSQQLAAFMPEKLTQSQESTTHVPSIRHARLRHNCLRDAKDQLKEGLKAFAITHNLILLAKGAVVEADLPDKTEEILALIQKGDF